MAMCYYKLDYFDVSQDLLATYLSHCPTSIIALNLKACNIFKLYNGKAAAAELKLITEQPHSYKFADDLLKHNMVMYIPFLLNARMYCDSCVGFGQSVRFQRRRRGIGCHDIAFGYHS